MTTMVHRGHVELGEAQLGATLTIEPGSVTLEVSSPGQMPNMPERIDLIRFTSNTGYFTLIDLLRRNHTMMLGVAGLSTYTARLGFESVHLDTRASARARTWSMHVEDMAKILQVNGVIEQFAIPSSGPAVLTFTVASPPPVVLACPTAGVTVTLRQHIRKEGDRITGPKLTLTYPTDVTFEEEVDVEIALRTMDRIRQLFSLVMGRGLPITRAAMFCEGGDTPHEVAIHGLLGPDASVKPDEPIVAGITADALAAMLDRWLSRYDELGDAIRLHMSGLEQRRLPTELRFQIFVQALEALHRRIAPTNAPPIDSAPILAVLREKGIKKDVVDRVKGVLAHAHEPGLRQRLRYYWDRFPDEIRALRPDQTRKAFVARIAATRNYYAHRTDPDRQVLFGIDLWDATEFVKALSHMALLREAGAQTAGLGASMLTRRFAEFAVRD